MNHTNAAQRECLRTLPATFSAGSHLAKAMGNAPGTRFMDSVAFDWETNGRGRCPRKRKAVIFKFFEFDTVDIM